VLFRSVAALFAGTRVLRVSGLDALRSVPAAESGVAGRRPLAAAALAATIAAVGWLARERAPHDQTLATLALIGGSFLAVSLLVPWQLRLLARVAENHLARVFRVSGLLAARNLRGAGARAGATVNMGMSALAGAIAMASLFMSVRTTIVHFMDGLFRNVALVITAGGDLTSPYRARMPATLADDVAGLPGVRAVDTIRLARVPYQDRLVVLASSDLDLHLRGLRSFIAVDGDLGEAERAAVAGTGALVSDTFSNRYHVGVGDTVVLPSPSGAASFRVAAVYFEPGFPDLGLVYLDRAVYRRLWQDRTVDMIQPILEPAADRAAISAEIRARWGSRFALFIVTVEQFRRQVEMLGEMAMALAWPVIAIAVAIAALALVNAMLAAIVERTRSIGLQRALGATRAQVRRSLLIEAGLIGLLGAVLGVVTGSAVGYLAVEVLMRGIFGMTVSFAYPLLAVLGGASLSIALAVLVGQLPAGIAARLEIVRALSYE